jgi:hypothetical protein
MTVVMMEFIIQFNSIHVYLRANLTAQMPITIIIIIIRAPFNQVK